jgi:hypothetical protein
MAGAGGALAVLPSGMMRLAGAMNSGLADNTRSRSGY